MKLGVLTSFDKDHVNFIKACEELKVDYELIDILSPDWIDKIKKSSCDGFLARPSCDMQERKSCFDERLFILNKVMGKPIYPSFDELFIYENKRNMYYWLEVNDFPHAKTLVFLRKDDALDYANKCSFPLIGKSNIGAGASGVIKIDNKKELNSYIKTIFGSLDGKICFGRSPVSKKFILPIPVIGKAQKHYIILQECIDVKWEWRIIKIDNSFFGYRKLLGANGFASGNNLDGWGEPPEELLMMVKDICEKGSFVSMAVDILESNDGQFFVNELQSHFGSYNPSQMYINDKPCRFNWSEENQKFTLEEGYFCQNGCGNLRVNHFLKLLGKEI